MLIELEADGGQAETPGSLMDSLLSGLITSIGESASHRPSSELGADDSPHIQPKTPRRLLAGPTISNSSFVTRPARISSNSSFASPPTLSSGRSGKRTLQAASANSPFTRSPTLSSPRLSPDSAKRVSERFSSKEPATGSVASSGLERVSSRLWSTALRRSRSTVRPLRTPSSRRSRSSESKIARYSCPAS